MEPVYYYSHYFIGPSFNSQGAASLHFGKSVSCIKISERPLQFLHHQRDENIKNLKKMNKRKIKGLTSVTLLFS